MNKQQRLEFGLIVMETVWDLTKPVSVAAAKQRLDTLSAFLDEFDQDMHFVDVVDGLREDLSKTSRGASV